MPSKYRRKGYFSSFLFVLVFVIAALGCSSRGKEAKGPVFLWKYKTKYQILSSPALDAEGNVYFGSQDNFVYALTPYGDELWKKELGSKVNSSPAIFENKLYIGCQDGHLYLLNITNGNVIKKYRTENSIHGSPAVDNEGNIFFGSYDGTFYALNPDATFKWKFTVGAIIDSSPAIDIESIYFTSTDGKLYALNPQTGELIWSFATDDKITASPAIGRDGTVYIGSHDKNFYAISPEGIEKWKFSTKGKIISSAAISSDGAIFFGSLDHYLYSLNAKGQPYWRANLKSEISSSPTVVRDGYIFVGSYDNNLYMLSPNGRVAWSYNLHDYVISSPNIFEDGSLYVGSMDYSLYAFKTSSIGYAISTWPGRGAGPANSGMVNVNTINTVRPYFEIVKTDTLLDKRESENTVLNFSSATAVSAASEEGVYYVYSILDSGSALGMLQFDEQGTITKSKKIASPFVNINTVFNDILTINFNSELYLIGGENNTNGIYLYALENKENPQLASTVLNNLLNEIDTPVAIEEISIGEKNYIYVTGKNDHGISVFQMQKNELINLFNIDNAENSSYALNSPSQLIVTQFHEKPMLITSSKSENGISLFLINKDGSLTFSDTIFDIQNKNYYMKSLNSFALLSEGETMYLVVGSTAENGISLFTISPDGEFGYLDSLNFSYYPEYGIQKLAKISSILVKNHYYLVAYDLSKKGGSVFTIDAKGVLFQFSNDETFDTGLLKTSNVTQIESKDNTFLMFSKHQKQELDIYRVVQ